MERFVCSEATDCMQAYYKVYSFDHILPPGSMTLNESLGDATDTFPGRDEGPG